VTYQTQRVAYPYFVVALLLFALQLVMGLYIAFNYFYTVPQAVVDVFPFATARAMHTNLLVLWLLLGFMGATYYAIPEETESELAWPRLAVFQLVLLSGTGVVALVWRDHAATPSGWVAWLVLARNLVWIDIVVSWLRVPIVRPEPTVAVPLQRRATDAAAEGIDAVLPFEAE